jgi:hypothetical protein
MTVRRNIHALLHGFFRLFLFIFKPNEALISSAEEPPPTCATLYYMLDIQLYLRASFHSSHKTQSISNGDAGLMSLGAMVTGV